jgi:hypothetical protein
LRGTEAASGRAAPAAASPDDGAPAPATVAARLPPVVGKAAAWLRLVGRWQVLQNPFPSVADLFVDDRVLFVHGSTGVLLYDAVEEFFDYFCSAPGIINFEFLSNSCPRETGSGLSLCECFELEIKIKLKLKLKLELK